VNPRLGRRERNDGERVDLPVTRFQTGKKVVI
jgi:hypothetical protein